MGTSLVVAAALAVTTLTATLTDVGTALSNRTATYYLAEASGPSPASHDTALAEASGPSPASHDTALAEASGPSPASHDTALAEASGPSPTGHDAALA